MKSEQEIKLQLESCKNQLTDMLLKRQFSIDLPLMTHIEHEIQTLEWVLGEKND